MNEEVEEVPKTGILDKYRERYKDREFNSDDEFHTALSEDFDDLDSYRTRNVGANGKLAELFEEEPELVALIKDMYAGMPFREAVAANVDIEALMPLEGDPDYDSMQANIQRRKEGVANRTKIAEEMDANRQTTLQEIAEFAQENDLDEKACMEFLQIVDDLIGDVAKGKISKSFLSNLKKALDYDKDVTTAEEVGRINGKNEKIETLKDKENGSGDGLPTLGGAGSSIAKETKKGGLSSLGLGIENEGSDPLSKLKLK